ncbi:hypothetical protein CM19_01150 [Candidatus Acidianus copahuensis]|uniref:Uncharacterized protein n=2 Tax=Candidatus Acidianus copahuensis TaxID=1160895 RepID=A0A031LW90_9CREN|nr:hypothetical protein CM19_01150 [Candidatus Acidianus copahuensis]
MEPSNFITWVLETYKTVWEKGYERGEEEKRDKGHEDVQKLDLESIIQEFKSRLIEEYKASKNPKKKAGE